MGGSQSVWTGEDNRVGSHAGRVSAVWRGRALTHSGAGRLGGAKPAEGAVSGLGNDLSSVGSECAIAL